MLRSIGGGSSHWQDGLKEERLGPDIVLNCAHVQDSGLLREPVATWGFLPCGCISEFLVPGVAVFSCFPVMHHHISYLKEASYQFMNWLETFSSVTAMNFCPQS